MHTIATLRKGEKGIIQEFEIEAIPLKLVEMGCLPGSVVELVQFAPFNDPLYINIDGSYVSIRKETAVQISIQKIAESNL
ncbi:MAG: ferrous iron transport protein A [Bacteroidetes bacterium MedPE-SWsnd-G1]|uniref:FeoA family protein n=1 Tax=Urechidicola vernalis TaxID=3075600 RepID=A0ABU2Y8S1_9FLAO|nr:FeoA family protein [Urechidicola sp. P050]MDT0554261.1 FeoA family protein [Urechidicola sp. P050]OIQ40897.1 MAG: ferrous iron transport protein A [Bacteroidetes bacterium MedPE-SWsnd-G1]